MSTTDIFSGAQTELPSHPVMAEVVSNIDPTFMGSLEVRILSQGSGNTKSAGQVYPVKMVTPFFGSTGYEYTTETDDYANTQKSYGMWFTPPDAGTIVLVIFINGDPGQGFWVGCIPDKFMNFSVPGLAATEASQSGEKEYGEGAAKRLPVAEYNKRFTDKVSTANPTKTVKPAHVFADVLEEQGLILDDIRGITSSSARREAPSAVFGISTPGPLDKKGPRGLVGKEESKANVFVSRLGGTTFVMDDGDDAFQRKEKASDGPPEYASVADQEEGLSDIPHNELFRIRTRTGHQILFHNSEDLIYIGNARGTSWIEMSSDGKIDIFAEDSISIHTKNDFNFYADRDINLEAGRNVNIKADNSMHTHAVNGSHDLIVGMNQKVFVGGYYSGTVEGDVREQFKSSFSLQVDRDYKISVVGGVLSAQTGNGIKLNNTGGNFEVLSAADLNLSSTTAFNINSITNLNLQSVDALNMLSAANIVATGSEIHFNGPAADPAVVVETSQLNITFTADDIPKALTTFSIPNEENEEATKSILARVPMHEPWPLHEHLSPTTFKIDQTDRDINGREGGIPGDELVNSNTFLTAPLAWKKYSTAKDTFAFDPPPN
jgi:hypothetical protein